MHRLCYCQPTARTHVMIFQRATNARAPIQIPHHGKHFQLSQHPGAKPPPRARADKLPSCLDYTTSIQSVRPDMRLRRSSRALSLSEHLSNRISASGGCWMGSWSCCCFEACLSRQIGSREVGDCSPIIVR